MLQTASLAPPAALVLDRFRCACTALLCAEEDQTLVRCQTDSRPLYRLFLAKETLASVPGRSPHRRFAVQVANLYLDQSLRRRRVFTGLLDHLEAHPAVAQVVVSNLLAANRPWLNGFLGRRGYQDKTNPLPQGALGRRVSSTPPSSIPAT